MVLRRDVRQQTLPHHWRLAWASVAIVVAVGLALYAIAIPGSNFVAKSARKITLRSWRKKRNAASSIKIG